MRKTEAALKEFGDTGLRRWGGILAEEWLQELRGTRGRKAFREMADNDPVIGAILFAIQQFAISAQVTVEPASDEPKDVEIAKFVEEALDNLHCPLIPDFIQEALSFIIYGFSLFEILYELKDNQLMWKDFSFRPQETIPRWEFDKSGHVLGVYQQKTSGEEVFIPIEKLIHIKSHPAKGSPEGRSLLRNAYTSYVIKKNLQILEGIGIERDLCGLPVLFVPQSIWANAQDRQQLKELLASLRRDEEEGLILPWDAASGREIYRLELLASRGSRQFSTSEIIARYDRAMAQSLMADLVMVGLEARGSFALAREKRSLLELTVRGLLSRIASALNSQAIVRLVDLNWPDRKSYPWITLTLPKVPSPDEVAGLIGAVARGGPLAEDQAFIRWVRSLIGAPLESALPSGNGPSFESEEGGNGTP